MRRKGKPRLARVCVAALAVACGPSGDGAREEPDSPARLLAVAIDQAGGAPALEAARALRWQGEATVHAGDRDVAIRGEWAIQPPDSAVVATYDTTAGPSTLRRLIVAGAAGWLEDDGAFEPMQPELLAAERDEFYLYHVMRLVPLRSPDVELAAIPPDTLGQQGFEVRAPGRPAVSVWVDDTGRLSHLRLRITDARTGGQAWQDLWLSGTVEAAGVRWSREIRITMDGAPYFDLTIGALRVAARLDEPYLAGPP
jgi:hypothetical protein